MLSAVMQTVASMVNDMLHHFGMRSAMDAARPNR
jgi:hypothetical protein